MTGDKGVTVRAAWLVLTMSAMTASVMTTPGADQRWLRTSGKRKRREPLATSDAPPSSLANTDWQ